MPTPIYGGKWTAAIATEVTPGTFVGSVVHIPIKPVSPKKNPNRKPLEVAMGTAFADMFVYDGEGLIEFTTEGPVYPTLSDLFMVQIGIQTGAGGAGTYLVSDPLASSLTINAPGFTSVQVAGCYADTIDISMRANQPVLCKVGWKGFVDPVLAGVSAPTIVAGRAFQWKDATQMTLLGAGSIKDVDDITLSIRNNIIPHRGNVGSSNPSHLIVGKRSTEFSFSKLLLGTLEYAKFLTAATTGTLVFGFANATPKSYAFTLSNVAYVEGNFEPDLSKQVKEVYKGYCETPTGTAPLSTVVV